MCTTLLLMSQVLSSADQTKNRSTKYYFRSIHMFSYCNGTSSGKHHIHEIDKGLSKKLHIFTAKPSSLSIRDLGRRQWHATEHAGRRSHPCRSLRCPCFPSLFVPTSHPPSVPLALSDESGAPLSPPAAPGKLVLF